MRQVRYSNGEFKGSLINLYTPVTPEGITLQQNRTPKMLSPSKAESKAAEPTLDPTVRAAAIERSALQPRWQPAVPRTSAYGTDVGHPL